MKFRRVLVGADLVQQDAASHVRQGDARQDHQRTDEQALRPCLENQFIRVGWLLHHVPTRHNAGNWTHDGRRVFEDAALLAEDARCDVTFGKVDNPPSTFYHGSERNANEREQRFMGESESGYEDKQVSWAILCPPPFLRISPCLLWTAGKKLIQRVRGTTQWRRR
jgi:hypothetical protein